jgi:uncharacterized protein YqeY
MSKEDVVRSEMVKAMKEHEKERKESLSMLLSALKNGRIDKREALTEAEEDAIIKKEIRQTQETFDLAPADRNDIRDAAKKRIAVYEEFVPADMNADQIKEVIAETLKEAGIAEPLKSDKGKIMKILMPKVKGKADGKLVNETLDSVLK